MINVKLYGTLRRLSQKDTPGLWQGELLPKSNIYDLIAIIGTTPLEVAAACINGDVCPFDAEIPDGAEVILVTYMGAG